MDRLLANQTGSAPPVLAVEPPAPALAPDSGGAPEMLADVLRRASEQPHPRRLVRVERDGTEVVLSYAEVRVLAERILGGLRASGARAGDEVILQLEAAEEFVPALWACILGGFTAVPVGVPGPHDGGGQAAQRLRDVWTTLDGPRVIAGTGLAAAVAAALGGGARVHAVAELAEHAPDPAWHPSRPADVAVLLLTSGTTGRPRLIQRTHHNLICVTMRNPGLAGFAEITFLGWLPLDHNAGLTATIAIMATGGDQVHLGIRDVLAAPEHWLDALHRYRVTHAAGTNYSLGLVNDLLAAGGGGAWDFSRIQSFVVGTEPVVARTVRAFLGHMAQYGLRPETLRPSYGMSEVGGITRLTGVRLDEDGGDAFVAAGTPFPGISLRVVDADGRPAPEGHEGRIQVRGDTVTPGYARDPEANRAAFTDDGWFDTGDNGVLRGGLLTVTGREKDVLIVNGLNIQAQEIEAAVEEIEGVERGCTAVAAVRGPGRDTDQAAVFLHTPLTDAEARGALRREVRRVAASRFGAGVAHVILLDRGDIPRTDLGKIQRAALRRRLEAGGFAAVVAEDVDTGSGQPYTPPRTELERELCGVWAAVLGVERVGIDDDFLALGGHSLLAARIAARMRAVSGGDVPLRMLFDHPTVAALARAVRAMRREGAPLGAALLPRAASQGPVPLSFAQQRLWSIDRMAPGGSAYTLSRALRLRGALDAAALERALGEVVRRHQALRTTFPQVGGAPVQVIAPFSGFRLAVEELSALGAREREAEVARRVADAWTRPFDLARGPLLRAGLLRLGIAEHVLLLGMHHIVGDAWSMEVLVRELSVLYHAFREGRESPLAELPVQYADYAVWQRQLLAGEVLDGQLAWWRERLAGAPALLALPLDHARPAVQGGRGAAEPVRIPPAVTERLRALGRVEGASLYMVLLGAFQALLSRYGGGDDVVVGSPIAGRTRPELEELIGCFVNTLALRGDLSGEPTVRELLRRTRETTLGAYEHQDIPFERLVEELRPARSLSYSPLFQVMFTLAARDAATLRLGGVQELRANAGSTAWDLDLTLAERDGGLAGTLEYRTELFEPATIRRMADAFATLLASMAARPDERISTLPLLAPAERWRSGTPPRTIFRETSASMR